MMLLWIPLLILLVLAIVWRPLAEVIRHGRRLAFLTTSGYMVAVAVALVASAISVALFALISLLTIMRLDHWLVSPLSRYESGS